MLYLDWTDGSKLYDYSRARFRPCACYCGFVGSGCTVVIEAGGTAG